jgi:hypothetical protein
MNKLQTELQAFCEKWNVSSDRVMTLLGMMEKLNGVHAVCSDMRIENSSASPASE